MKYKFHPGARREFEQAIDYYEEQKAGLGDRFRGIVESSVKEIVKRPESWPFIEHDARCFLTDVFPYSIIYTQESAYVLIVSVMHQSRKPGYWLDRLG